MTMDLYPWLLLIHRSCVALSLSLFLLRAVGVLRGQAWPMRANWRWLSVGIDTLLLSAGASLWYVLALNPLQQTWLGAKLMLLVLYIGLGSLALKRAPSLRGKSLALGAAVAIAAIMVGIGWTRHPLGWFAI